MNAASISVCSTAEKVILLPFESAGGGVKGGNRVKNRKLRKVLVLSCSPVQVNVSAAE